MSMNNLKIDIHSCFWNLNASEQSRFTSRDSENINFKNADSFSVHTRHACNSLSKSLPNVISTRNIFFFLYSVIITVLVLFALRRCNRCWWLLCGKIFIYFPVFFFFSFKEWKTLQWNRMFHFRLNIRYPLFLFWINALPMNTTADK